MNDAALQPDRDRFGTIGDLGSARTEGFVRQSRALALNEWRVEGDWQVGTQSVALTRGGGRIIARFHARDLHLVMGPVKRNTSIRFRVTIDGQAPAGAHGFDIDEDGAGTATDQRLYQLVRQPGPVADRTFAITFLDPGIEGYAFTFG